MQIRELYLKNFGKFSDRTFLIRDGIHVFYGENEFGKSTLYAFIKGMLFGMERARGRASKNDAFSQYEPWENPNYYAGVLRFESGGRNFRIERSFDKITKSASLICEDDGEELSIEQGDLDVLLDGMTESSFENTIAIGQLRVETSQDLAVELKNYAANYYESGDSEIDVQRAMEILKFRQHEVDLHIRQESLKKERMRSRIEQECEYVRRDLEKLKADEREAKLMQEETAEDEEIVETEEPTRRERVVRRRGVTLTAVILLVAIGVEAALYFVTKGRPWNVPILIVGALIDLFLFVQMLRFLLPKEERRYDISQEEAEKSTPAQHRRWEIGRIRANIHEKQIALNNLNERLEELETSGFEITQEDQKRQAIQLASETILQLSSEIIKGFGNTLNEKASEIISAITDGKYEKIYIDEKLNMFLLTREKRVPIERLSRGTIEQIYFALRMAAIDVLYEEDFPVILDDTFVFYDDARLTSVLRWLAAQKRQVILFTCQKRESEILERLNIPFSIN